MASSYFGHSWRVNEDKKTASKICGKCGGLGGWSGWPGFTCFNCGGSPVLKVIPLSEYQEMVAKQEARETKRAEKAAKIDKILIPHIHEWNKLMLLCFKALTIFKQQGKRVPYSIYRCQDGRTFPRGKWLRESTWIAKIEEAKAPVLADLMSLPKDWEDYVYVAPVVEEKPESQHLGSVGDRGSFELTILSKKVWEGHYGDTFFYIMKDDKENLFTWKASRPIRKDGEAVQRGDKVCLKGTIKDHTEYENRRTGEITKQNVLTRCKLVTVELKVAQ